MKQLVSLPKSLVGGVRWKKRNTVLPTSALGASTRSRELAIVREPSTGNREDPQTSSAEMTDEPSKHGPGSFQMDDCLCKAGPHMI